MRRCMSGRSGWKRGSVLLAALSLLMTFACARKAPASKTPADSPFEYPFVHPLAIEPQAGKPYSDFKAFYLLTEDFEPRMESTADIAGIREALSFAAALTAKYHLPWTHFVDANVLAPGYVGDDDTVKQACLQMVGDLRQIAASGDDCELHLHGGLDHRLVEQLRSEEKLHAKSSIEDALPDYRLRRSFFFHSFYDGGNREMVASLVYGRRLLERALYDGKKTVIAFRPGGWDHGSSQADALLYFNALAAAGLLVNSGLATGHFGKSDYRIGNDPGRNLATISAGERQIIEISPTAGPGGYVNPVLPADLERLASSVTNSVPVIVSVYHLNSLQSGDTQSDEVVGAPATNQREALEKHFQQVAALAERRVLYPLTMRQLLEIIQQK